MTKKILNIVEIVFLAILVVIIGILVCYIVMKGINKNKPTKMFGYYVFEVGSWSMYDEESPDSLSKGDLIFVKELDSNKYEVGMVVTYQVDDTMPTTHKIVARDGDIITTRGINKEGNTTDDPPFDVKNILGQVKGVWHGYGKFIAWTTSPLGIISIVLFLFLIYEGFELLKKALGKKQEPNNDIDQSTNK